MVSMVASLERLNNALVWDSKMEISVTTRNSLVFLGFLTTVTSLIWLLAATVVYWNTPYQAVGLYECRWLLSPLVVTSFFFYLFVNSASLIMFTAAYAAAQYALAYSVVSVAFNAINFFQIFAVWTAKDRNESMDFIRLNAFIAFLSIVGVCVTFCLLKHLIQLARTIEQNIQPLERRHQIMFCSVLDLLLGFLSFAVCYEMSANAPYASSFIVQHICCTCSSLSIAYMQWRVRDACNMHILRIIIVMNVCQFVQEVTYAYSTYMLIMIAGRKSGMPANRFDTVDQPEVVHLLIGSFAIHCVRLLTCTYPVAYFAKKAFPIEVLRCIRFLSNHQRGISAAQAKQAAHAGAYFFLAIGLIVLSAKSTLFCFRTITQHTPLCTQSVAIIGPLRWLTNLAYALIVTVSIEILFTALMYKFFSTRIDFVLGTELFLWINSISTCLLQIWVCKHERFQRCVIILIVQLISDCLTTLLLILVQASIVQTVVIMMTRHSRTFRHTSPRIIYIVIDHVLQIVQWALNICSLGLALVVLDRVETEDDDFSDGTVEDDVFLGQSMRDLLSRDILQAPTMGDLLVTEYNSPTYELFTIEDNPETDHTRCSAEFFLGV
uniref:G protein-coupled receptor n=1 Tax=Elaeophora elaphi TaxID=1147741 RepID=A0A0R3RS73_9BILA